MIEIFQGRLGGGKTYSSVVRIAAHLAKGLHVFTNIELHFEGLYEYCLTVFKVKITKEQIHYFESDNLLHVYKDIPLGLKTAPILIAVDEAGIFINSKSWAATQKENPHFASWLKHTRKVYQDVIFIAQSAKDVDTSVRRLTQHIWGFRDMDKFLFFGSIPFLKGKIRWIQLDLDGKTVMRSGFSKKDVRVFACYNTDALLKTWDCPDENLQKVQLEKVEVKKMNNPYIMGFFALAGVAGLAYLGFSIFGPKDVPQRAVAPVPVMAQKVVNQTQQPRQSIQHPVKETARVLGFVTSNGVLSAFVKINDLEARYFKEGDGFRGSEVIAVSQTGMVLDRGGEIVRVEFDFSPIPEENPKDQSKEIPSVTASLTSAYGNLLK